MEPLESQIRVGGENAARVSKDLSYFPPSVAIEFCIYASTRFVAETSRCRVVRSAHLSIFMLFLQGVNESLGQKVRAGWVFAVPGKEGVKYANARWGNRKMKDARRREGDIYCKYEDEWRAVL